MTEEHVIGIIPNASSGFLGQKSFNLIVTNQRLIVAHLTMDMIKEAVQQQTQESKEQGDGVLKGMAKRMAAAQTVHQKYVTMAPEQIIQEHEGNYAISETAMHKIRLHEGRMLHDGRSEPAEVKLVWDAGKGTFRFTSISAIEAKKMLQQVFGAKVK